MEKYCTAVRTTDDNMAHVVKLKSHTHTHTQYVITHRFFTTKMVARKRLNIMLYVHCLSCYTCENSCISEIRFATSSDNVCCQVCIHFVQYSSGLCERSLCNFQSVCMLPTGCPFVFHITVTMNGNYFNNSNNLLVFVTGM